MSKQYYRPMTPSFRNEINRSLDIQMNELNTCEDNAFVSMAKMQINATRIVMNALPNGYMIPMEKQ